MKPVLATVTVLVVLALPAMPVPLAQDTPADPFSFFDSVFKLTASDRRKIDKGAPLVRTLPARGHEIAVFVALSVKADAARLTAWMRDIVALKKGRFVLAIGKFSTPPVLEDLQDLTLDDADLDAVRSCRSGDCGLKLAASEIVELQSAISGRRDDWKMPLQDAFRKLVLQRVRTYLTEGHAAFPAYNDHSRPVRLDATFRAIVQHSAPLPEKRPRLVEYLDRYPRVEDPAIESFLYWSKEKIAGKPQVSVTHISIVQGGTSVQPDVLVAAKQVFTTHYMNGSLSLTTLMHGPAGENNYLVYINRSDVDVIGGLFGGIVRSIIGRRLRSEAPTLLKGLRERLESGDPPGKPGQ